MAAPPPRLASLRTALSVKGLHRAPVPLCGATPELERALVALRWLRLACMVVGVLGIAAAVVAANLVFAARVNNPETNPRGISDQAHVAKLSSSILTSVLLLLIVLKAALLFRIRVLRGHLLPRQTFFETDLWRALVVELAVCAIHCPAGVYALVTTVNPIDVEITYDLDSLLSACMFARLFVVMMLIVREVTGVQSVALRSVKQLEGSSEFVLRCLLEQRPIVASSGVFLVFMTVLAYAVRIAEEPVCYSPDAVALGWCTPYRSLRDYSNAVWLIVVTALTIGFGDILVYTTIGRFVVGIAGVAGVINIAVIVNSVGRAVAFSDAEVNSIRDIGVRRLAVNRKHLAASVIAAFLFFAHDRCVSTQGGRAAGRGAPGGRGGKKGAPLAPPHMKSLRRLVQRLREWVPVRRAWGNVQQHSAAPAAQDEALVAAHSIRSELAAVASDVRRLIADVAALRGAARGGGYSGGGGVGRGGGSKSIDLFTH